MAENAASAANGAGDAISSSSSADVRVQREALLTEDLAVECATKMFTQRAEGPHASDMPTVAARPTPEEIIIAQAAVLAAIGEKGSEKRARANSLCADGLLDLEQCLGYLLCDRFKSEMPSPIKAREIGKRAADKPPGKKEKERWKEKAKSARQAAKKAGADEEAVAAAGRTARDKAQAACLQVEVTIKGLSAASSPPPPPEPEPEPKPAAHVCSDACSAEACPRARAIVTASQVLRCNT